MVLGDLYFHPAATCEAQFCDDDDEDGNDDGYILDR